jgi:virulence factor Mce-like protein
MKLRYAITFAVFGLVTAYSVYYIASLGVRVRPPQDRINVSMQVADTNGLVVDSNVLLRGVPVGKVTKIQASIEQATIDFYVDRRFLIPVDSEVRLENLSALGETYVGLVPRTTSGPMLRDGQRVATKDVKAPASISQLAATVAHFLGEMDPGQLSRLVDEADRALPNQNAVLPNLTRASTLLRDTATSMDGRGSQMLANFQTLLQNAGWVGPAIAAIDPPLLDLAHNSSMIYDNAVNRLFNLIGPPEALNIVGRLLNRIQKFLDDRAPDIKVISQALMPNVQGVATALLNVDTGQILTHMLDAFPEDGVVTLHLTVPNP